MVVIAKLGLMRWQRMSKHISKQKVEHACLSYLDDSECNPLKDFEV